MRFLLDHCVPASVASVLTDRGHAVFFLTDVLPQDAPDQIVARVSELNGFILVTQDGDFKNIAKRIPDGAKNSVKKLSRISLECKSPRCAKRMKAAILFIEFEWETCQKASDARMFIVIRTIGCD